MRGIFLRTLAMMALGVLASGTAAAQRGGVGGIGGGGRPGTGSIDPGGGDLQSTPIAEKPDQASKKAYAAGLKSLNKAKEYEAIAAQATNPDKKGKALDKVSDSYNRALDQFTEALRNRGDMVEAWDNVGYVHLKLGAYGEAVDDYNHTLTLKPDLMEAIEHRAEAWLAIDRVDDVKSAYMDLFNHERPLADQLLMSMQQWVIDHRTNPNGMRPASIDAFGKWVDERDGIAKQTASLPH